MEPGLNRRDRVRSGLAGDGTGARGRLLGRRSAEGVRRRPEERAPKKHSSKEADGASGPRPPDNRHLRLETGQRERKRELTLWTHKKFTGLYRGTERRWWRPEIGAPE
ncbi:hypothetical protein NDU88_000778 [Pleurodeles waltl]|uniref:Uncharacterized protein n=1 Tax=Pleurodeles waltl TaxID=8319 RepID=A0AAV7MLT9_PLEWA|nr:hypothetical protein NDU88_000778 [Pleurodeles waltl]